jgi:hypothetical protein
LQVTDWGSGNPEELGGLQMDGNSQVVETGGNPDQPFYEALARRLELLQKQGALGVAQVRPGPQLLGCSCRLLPAGPWLAGCGLLPSHHNEHWVWLGGARFHV